MKSKTDGGEFRSSFCDLDARRSYRFLRVAISQNSSWTDFATEGNYSLCWMVCCTSVLAYVGLFFALLGAEELLDVSLIGEGYARSLVILGGGGLALVALGTVVLSIVVLFVRGKAI